MASKRRPTTIGKVEAYHKAYVYEAWMYDGLREFCITGTMRDLTRL